MRQIERAWFIALKDLRLFAGDRLALFFGLLFPFLFATAFYFVMQGVGGNDERLVLHLVTREAKGMSSQIIEAMVTRDDAQLKPGEAKIVWDRDYDKALQSVRDKKIPGFIAFPADFTRGVSMGYGATLEVVVDAESAAAEAALRGFAKGIAARVGAEQVSGRATMAARMGPGMASGNRADIMKAVEESLPDLSGGNESGRKAEEDLITFDVVNMGKPERKNPSNFVIPGYLVMFVFFLAAMGSEAIVRERQNQTLERLLASSVRREAILGGIFAGTALRGIVQVLLFWIVGILLFRMNLGTSPPAVILLSVLMVLASSAFSLMLSTLVRTQRAAIAIGVLTSLVLAPLGGCWWPLFITPRWMQFLARLTPHGWATTGFNKLMVFGGDATTALPNMYALAGFTLLFGVIAIWRFRTSVV
jgi:ABC-2 type transport system permease protein